MQKLSMVLAGAVLALLAAATARAQDEGVPAARPYEYRPIPGVSPEPIAQGAGLKGAEDLEAFIDGIMTAHLKAQKAAGAVVSVVKDGKLLLAKGYGYADVEKRIPADGHATLFRNGSVSKTFTFTALMQLIEQGKVAMDADVNTYLTQFKLPDTWPGKPLTVRHLFTHTGGLEDGSLGYLIVDKLERMDEPAQALAKHIPRRIRPPTEDFATGDNSAYSNWGASLAGLIVANVSGMSFDDYVEKNIFAPLGMDHSTFRQPLPPELAAKLSKGYKYENGRHEPQGFEFVNFAPAGSMSVTAADMARFMIAHLQGGAAGEGSARILSEESAKLMHSRVMSPNPHINGAGLGFYENHVNGRRQLVHAGDTRYFHSEMNLLPEENLGIFFSVNSLPTLPFSARSDLFSAFMDRYYPAKLPQLEPPPDFSQRAARYTGSYRMNRHSHSSNEKMFGMMAALRVAPTKHDTLLVSFGPYAWEYVEVAPSVFRRMDGDQMIAFVEDSAGKVRYLLNPLSLSFIGAYRIPAYESPPVLGLILGLAALCFVAAIVSALRHWKLDRTALPGPRRARRLAALVGALNLLFLAGIGLVVATLSKGSASGWPGSFKLFLALPLVAIPLTLALLVLAVLAWKNGWWTRYGRVQYSAIVVAALAFVWLLSLANLIGYNFS